MARTLAEFPLLFSIARRRKDLGISQAKLAALCGIGQPFVAKIERGETMPSYAIAVKLFEALDRLESKHSREAPRLLHARDVMVKKVITVASAGRAEEARRIMLDRDISQLPVIDSRNGALKGSITEKTFLGKEIKGRKVRDVMDRGIFPAVAADTKLPVIISILKQEGQQAVLVMEKAKVRGIITKHDLLLKCMPEH